MPERYLGKNAEIRNLIRLDLRCLCAKNQNRLSYRGGEDTMLADIWRAHNVLPSE